MEPVTSDGRLQPIAMNTVWVRLIERLRKLDRPDRIRVYHPHKNGGVPIYLHTKIFGQRRHTPAHWIFEHEQPLAASRRRMRHYN